MTNIEFYEQAIHTDINEVSSLRDRNAAQFLMKMAALGATVTFRFTSQLDLVAETPVGQYMFVFEAPPGDELTVFQIL